MTIGASFLLLAAAEAPQQLTLSPEILAIIGVGLALYATLAPGLSQIRENVKNLGERMSKLEGKLEGFIAGFNSSGNSGIGGGGGQETTAHNTNGSDEMVH